MTPPSSQCTYGCPRGHRWCDLSDVAAPLVNIKCPHCGATAMLEGSHDHIVHTWPVQPVRHLSADVPPPGGPR